jgi:PAS domain S-box-containing protein
MVLFLMLGGALSVFGGKRLRTQSEIRRIRYNLETAQEVAGIGSWVSDLIEGALWWSPGTYKIFSALEGTPVSRGLFYEFVHPEDRARVEEAAATAVKQKVDYDVEHRIIRTDGQIRHVHQKAKIFLENEHVICLIGSIQDVTEAKKEHEDLITEHRKNTVILESISDGVFGFDRDWRFTHVNPAAAKMLGKDPEELMGKVIWDLSPNLSNSAVAKAYRRAVAENVPVQIEAFYPEPVARWMDIRCYPSTEGLAVFFTDTTERRQAEDRLRQKQKLETVGLLAGGVAHDFNNLLTVIMGSASLAVTECPSCQYLQSILSTAERAAYLTRQLLTYAGKAQSVAKLVDVSEVISEAKQLLETSIPKRVSLRIAAAESLPFVEIDPSQLEQILMNLVINAGEAIPIKSDGEIHITVRRVEISPAEASSYSTGYDVAPGSYVCIQVSDNGTGMDSATVSRIFDPFFSTKFTGRGLGLAAVYGIVRGRKGLIDVSTAPGQGTTFRVFLPASDTEPAPERLLSTRAPERTVAKVATVLVIDDEEMVRKLACMSLRHYGYETLEAENGKQALEILANCRSPPALVLLDLAMPVMGGDELMPILVARYPHLKVIVSSGYAEEDARKLDHFPSVAGILEKPYTAAALYEKVASALE